jgi:hypothetical protein
VEISGVNHDVPERHEKANSANLFILFSGCIAFALLSSVRILLIFKQTVVTPVRG